MTNTAFFLAMLSFVLPAACPPLPPDPPRKVDGPAGIVVFNNQTDHRLAKEKTAFYEQVAGKTLHFNDPAHGTQIEYFDKNGRAYLWYPGNRFAVPSEWKIRAPRPDHSFFLICFRFSSRSYNPATKQFGGQWECRESRGFAESLNAIPSEDPYALASGAIPKVLPCQKVLPYKEVARLAGKSNSINVLWKREARP